MDTLVELARAASDYVHFRSQHAPILKLIKKDRVLKDYLYQLEPKLTGFRLVYEPQAPCQAEPDKSLKAVTWNIERGKSLESLCESFKNHPKLKEAQVILLTEVDWGMARSHNLNITAELAKVTDMYGYFAPSFFNLTKGHSNELLVGGKNELGLHGKSILSRYPLMDVGSIPLANTVNLLMAKEPRLGQKNALMAKLKWGDRTLTLACAHLDCYSSPKTRASQMKKLLEVVKGQEHVLIAGDWNTNTLNTTTPGFLLLSLVRQVMKGPKKMVQKAYPFPDRTFDKPLFTLLDSYDYQYESFNEDGVGTYDLRVNAEDLGAMARDRIPQWILKSINKMVAHCGGLISLKIDWFAAKGLKARKTRVVKLKQGRDYMGKDPSDHHPVFLDCQLKI